MVGTLAGTWTNWVLCDVSRKYGTVQALPFSEVQNFLMAVRFNGQTGKGQQRELIEPHVRKLKKEMETGRFTPTPTSASLAPQHRDKLVLNDDGTFVLPVDSEDPLLETDGGHRYAALAALIADLRTDLERATDDEEKSRLARWLAQAEAVPVTITVYFDGDPSLDFAALQAGRPVDASHMKSLAVHTGRVADPAQLLAHKVARLLHTEEGSPFEKSIKFDSRGVLPLPISTLTGTGSSDIGTSLVGLARVGRSDEGGERDENFLARAVVDAYQRLEEVDQKMSADKKSGILDYGKYLTPIDNEGTKGSSTMLTGVGVCLAYRLVDRGKAEAGEEELAALEAAALATLDRKVNGNFSGPAKRTALGRFAKEFFADLDVPKYQGIPTGLFKALSYSTFGVTAPPKVKKEKKPKAKKAKKKVENPLPNVDAVVVTNEPVTVPASAPAVGAVWDVATEVAG